MSLTRRDTGVLGLGRRTGRPLFVVGLGLMVSGLGWDVPAMWISGFALFIVGIALLWRRRSEFSVY